MSTARRRPANQSVEVRLATVETAVDQIHSDVRGIRAELKAIADAVASSGKPNWGTWAAIAAVAVAIIVGQAKLVTGPLHDEQVNAREERHHNEREIHELEKLVQRHLGAATERQNFIHKLGDLVDTLAEDMKNMNRHMHDELTNFNREVGIIRERTAAGIRQ